MFLSRSKNNKTIASSNFNYFGLQFDDGIYIIQRYQQQMQKQYYFGIHNPASSRQPSLWQQIMPRQFELYKSSNLQFSPIKILIQKFISSSIWILDLLKYYESNVYNIFIRNSFANSSNHQYRNYTSTQFVNSLPGYLIAILSIIIIIAVQFSFVPILIALIE